MKISASIYSDKKRDLKSVIEDLAAHHVDLLHVDCNDDPKVFDDIQAIRNWTKIPIDLHIITENPEKYFDLLRNTPVEYVTFQLEDAKTSLKLPADIPGKKGLAMISPTDVERFDEYAEYDFVLFMATIPGQSGGVFDPINFQKIRHFQQKYPVKPVHVDGGVNGEVSFILRNMGVQSSVSGSFLFNAPSIGHALMDLTKRDVVSHFALKDFMIPLNEAPKVRENSTAMEVLESIEKGGLGFTLVIHENNQFSGLCSNADIRKALLKFEGNVTNRTVKELMNQQPISIQESKTVNDLMNLVKSYSFPISYLPVLNNDGKAVGIVTFVNLIKGEL